MSRDDRGFDRIKTPDGWSRRQDEANDPKGRAALFTGADEAVKSAPAGPADGFRITCSSCGTVSRVDARTLGRMAIPLFLVAPWRRHPVFAVCPACNTRSWLRVGV